MLNYIQNIESANSIDYLNLNTIRYLLVLRKKENMALPSNLQVLRYRLVNILNDKFKNIYSKYQNNYSFSINQAKLEDWTELIDQIIISKLAAKKIQLNYNSKPISSLAKTLYIQKPIQEHLNPLLKIQEKSIQIFTPSKSKSKGKSNQFTIHKQKIQLQSQIISKNSSCTVVSQFSAIFIGGCASRINPNLKSSKILQFMIKTGEIYQISKLPYGLSSHGSIFIQNFIYIIGGNKDHGIISRGCFCFCLKTKLVEEISCLNYPTSSMCLVNWKNQFIYKFGGLGQCFESWGLSPYIQRYSIQNDFWETINPSLSQSCKQYFDNYNLMVQSFGYVTKSDKIIVFGGFNLQGQGQNIGFVMKVQNQQNQQKQKQQDIQEDYSQNHIIDEIGQVKYLTKGGFFNSQFIYSKSQNCLHFIQRKQDKQRNYSQEFNQINFQ